MVGVAASEDLARSVLAALDALDVPAMGALVSDDVRARLGNADVVEGREGFVATAEAFVASIAGIRHEIRSLWSIDEAVIAEMDVHYERLDGQQLTLPCCNTFRIDHGRIAEYRVYMDISPVFA